MSLTPEQIAKGWKLHDGGPCPIKDRRTVAAVEWKWSGEILIDDDWLESGWDRNEINAYRIIEAHGADAEPARPTPFPASYGELVFDTDGWSQTIIVDGKRPEWLRDDDECTGVHRRKAKGWRGRQWTDDEIAIRVRRREPKRETVKGTLSCQGNYWLVSYDLIDGKPDLSTLKIAEDAL